MTLKKRGNPKMKWIYLYRGCGHGCKNWVWLCPKHQREHEKISSVPAGIPNDKSHSICVCCYKEGVYD